MLLLERDPLVIQDWSRSVSILSTSSNDNRPTGMQPPARRATLLLWTVVVAMLHFDRGASTVSAMDLVTGWDDGSTTALGSSWPGSGVLSLSVALTAWHSVGTVAGSTLAGAVFQQASAKLVLILALCINAAANLVLSFQSPDPGLMVASLLRGIAGMAASIPLVFLPLWVDEFSPSEANAQWMSYMQMGAPFGQFCGIALAGVLTQSFRSSNGLDWRFVLFIQAIVLVPVILRIGLIPAMQIDVSNIASLRARLDSLTLHPTEGLPDVHSLVRELREMLQGLWRNPLYVSLTTTLCFLHATAAGLVLWAAPYLAVSSAAPPPIVSLIFTALSLAAMPVIGTYAGALLCDRLGGFQSGQHSAALRVGCGFVGMAALAGPLCGGAGSFGGRLMLLWLWLFGAGAFLPISAGVLMTSMPSYLRSFSAASSVLMFHIIGFAVVTSFTSTIMGCFGTPDEGLAFGVCFVLWLTAPAAVLLILAYMKEPKNAGPIGLAGADDLTFSEINYELSRRRVSTTPL
eukprot:gnl/TRDRNA2_/TRDRNA2_195906_c0_seq1.p1 gnl/TRDRNA2_/TRDRNA2_195906_c0~~gnl/TRDRNA2_/TRDRNA2_195906_c0_seq1.p1  ORF type:complete len:517 (+),score=84.62 gnl/TRDRNA2_/TRDRNA2_195906_c0_seq1:49-1599(+)